MITLKDKIQMVDLVGQYHRIQPEIDQAILDVVKSAAYINGPQVKEFAEDLENYLGVKHVIPCANGTDALQIALMSLGLKPGDEVITPSFTYIATVEVIALLGLIPKFVEVNPDTFNIDLEKVKEAISENTKAIVPVHLYGQCADMEPLISLANEHDIPLVEDTAQALGSVYTFSDGSTRKAGTMGTIGCTSFFPSKNLGCFGDGGAIFTNDSDLYERIRKTANHGQSVKYQHDLIGVNSRLDTIQAAVLKVKLKYLDEYSKARNKAATYYNERLSSLRGISTPKVEKNTTHVYHQYTIKLDGVDRKAFQDYLSSQGVPSNIYYPTPVHLQKGYTEYRIDRTQLQNTEFLCENVISLPIHTEMTEDQLDHICSVVEKYINKTNI